MNSDFKDLISLFEKHRVRYLIVGGYAVMYYTEPRYTKDIDLLIGAASEEVEQVAIALAEFGFPMSREQIEQLKRPNQMIVLGVPPSRIDILNEITGIEFEKSWESREIGVVGEMSINFIGLTDLILAKRAAGRPQDLLDVAKLEQKPRQS